MGWLKIMDRPRRRKSVNAIRKNNESQKRTRRTDEEEDCWGETLECVLEEKRRRKVKEVKDSDGTTVTERKDLGRQASTFLQSDHL